MTSYVATLSQVAQQYQNASNLSARQRIYAYAKPGPSWQDWVFDQLALPVKARILELGCGNAMLWKSNLSRIPSPWQITLSDASPGMIDAARQTLSDSPHRFVFTQINAENIPFTNGSFDAVIANHMLYHVPNRDHAIAEVRRLLNANGTFYVATNGRAHLHELKELINRFVPSAWEDSTVLPGTPFTLETAEPELARHFSKIELLRPPNGELMVPDIQAILDYALSIERAKPTLVGEKLQELRNAVQQIIERNGAFRITPVVGMFRAG
jgi:ubiquinone/menaquinone biosynthesis C-methylase UbiE